MIALVSFPRSGNTFFRNLMFELYGLSSSTFHREAARELAAGWADYPIVKTHLLPEDLPEEMKNSIVIYLVRDGRDALVSLAHHRKDLVEPGTNFYNNLLEAILSLSGSNFGGWSGNVEAWSKQATIVVKYEDLIVDPIAQTERLRSVLELPEPILERLPTFEDLKFGTPQYGAESSLSQATDFAQKFFRKGKQGSWREEMPDELHRLFWDLHRETMIRMRYTEAALPPAADRPLKKVLIEIGKAYERDNDGVKRYLLDLLHHLAIFQEVQSDWQIDLLFEGDIQPLTRVGGDQLFESFEPIEQLPHENFLLKIKARIQRILPSIIYRPLSKLYRQGPFRRLLAAFREREVEAAIERKNTELYQRVAAYDLLHVPLPQHLGKVRKFNLPKVVTVHDLTHRILPEYHTQENIRLAEEGMQLAEQAEMHYLAISQATADDLVAELPTARARTTIIHEGVSHRFHRQARDQDFELLRTKYGLPKTGEYLLSLSTVEPRKNIRHLIEAFLEMKARYPDCSTHLYICGKQGWLTEDLYERELAYREQGIYFTGFVDDLDLPILYAHARALCYVSHYEGFGLPILEAMRSGVPVIYGNNSSMPEVAGDGGIGVDSRDREQLIDAMQKLINDDVLHRELATAAWQQANRFSLLKSAFETLAYYEKIIAKISV